VEYPFRVIKRQFGFVKVRSWIEEKHSAVGVAVCLVQFVDVARKIDCGSGISAPESRVKALCSVKRAHEGAENDGILQDCS
jgi:hypothetical protein